MALTYEFLMARAEHEAGVAASALLDNVRDRALRAEAAWRTMAKQVLAVANSREQAQQERLAAERLCNAAQ